MAVKTDIKALFEAGAHFGHKTSRWHPKMAPYIHSKRQDAHIIDLVKTVEALDTALPFLTSVAASGKKVLFVGTKKQIKDIVQASAEAASQPYVTERWIGGMLTNVTTITAQLKKLRELEKQRDVRKEMQSLVKSGMNEHDALGLAEQKVSLTYKIEDKREREKKEKEDSRARAQEISDAFKTRFDAVQQTLSSVSRVGSGFGSLFNLVGKGDAGLSAAVDSLTKEVQTSNGYLRTIAEKAEKGGVALFS